MTKFASSPMMRGLAAGIRANVPTLLWGNPGVAKSAKTTSFATASGYHCETVVGSVREASDYLGLPIEIDGQVHYSTLSWAQRLADAEQGLLFLDELTTAAPSVQKAMLRVLQERYVGEFQLPASVAIVAAANPPETAADGWDLPAPVANRLMHLDWQFDAEEWLSGVLTSFQHTTMPAIDVMLGSGADTDAAKVAGMVTGFLRARPGLLAPAPPSDPTRAGRAWPSPRSWTNAIAVLSELHPGDGETRLLTLTGCVGEGATTEFLAWEFLADLPDPADVIDDPDGVDWAGTRPDRLFALTGSIAALVQTRADVTTWQKGVRALTVCAANQRADVALPAMRTLLNNRPKGTTIADVTRNAFADLFGRIGSWQAAA